MTPPDSSLIWFCTFFAAAVISVLYSFIVSLKSSSFGLDIFERFEIWLLLVDKLLLGHLGISELRLSSV